MKLYEIKDSILNTVNEDGQLIDTSTGEVMTKEQFEKLCGDLNDGIENLVCWVKSLRAEANAIKVEKDVLDERQKSCEKHADNLENYVKYLLDGATFKTAKCAVSYRISHPLEIDDQSLIPIEWFKVVEPTVDKLAITKAIKSGEVVPGCHLGDKVNMQIK